MSSRRSSRLKDKEPVTFVELDAVSDEEEGAFSPAHPEYDDPDDDDDAPEPKRRKRMSMKKGEQSSSKQKNVKGRLGKLAKLPDMPLDILFEVSFLSTLVCFSTVHPLYTSAMTDVIVGWRRFMSLPCFTACLMCRADLWPSQPYGSFESCSDYESSSRCAHVSLFEDYLEASPGFL
jgi:hypothetical protein